MSRANIEKVLEVVDLLRAIDPDFRAMSRLAVIDVLVAAEGREPEAVARLALVRTRLERLALIRDHAMKLYGACGCATVNFDTFFGIYLEAVRGVALAARCIESITGVPFPMR